MSTITARTSLPRTLADSSERLPLIFSTLGDPCRFQIMRLLTRKRGICVTDIALRCGISVSAASQQFRLLELAGLVRRKRQGRMICFRVRDTDPTIKALLRVMHGRGHPR